MMDSVSLYGMTLEKILDMVAMKVKIAVVQFEVKNVAPKVNLERAKKFVRSASKASANIIVFPENFITSAATDDGQAADDKNEYRRYFQTLAKKYRIDIVPGAIIEKYQGALYLVSYYIDSTGEVLAHYKKINLWHTERETFTPGKDIAVFKTKYGKVGLIICWDLVYPELFRAMVKRGVEIVICPSAGGYEDSGKIGNRHDPNNEIKMVDALCEARAFENEIILVYCNAGGKINIPKPVGKLTDTLIGHSQITVPFKGAVKKLAHNREEMFITELETDILKDAESVYRIRADLKSGKF